jgi:hypothetical protein
MKKQPVAILIGILGAAFCSTLLAQNTFEPTVIIRATQPWASEIRSSNGTFTVERTGPTNFALLVFYRLSGTASNGVDYEQLGNNVQIPAGGLRASFQVNPVDDSLAEGTEFVLAELTASPLACATCGYRIGDPNNAEVFIADNDPRDGTNDPPVVQLNEPRSGDIFRMPANITLQAYAQDREDHFDLQVEFLEGTNSLGFGKFFATTCPAPYCPFFQLVWSNAPTGEHVLRAKVVDSHGAATISEPVVILVIGAVNIYATDSEASELNTGPNIDPASNPAVFTVRRFGDANEGIVVYYEVSGTASNGVDYMKLPGFVNLPQGVSSAEIVVQPISDNLTEGIESVVLTLQATCPQCLFTNPRCLPPQGTNCYPLGPDIRAVATIRDGTAVNRKPEVRVVRLVDGEQFPAQSDIQLVAFADDPEDGYFVAVEFFAGTQSLGPGTFNPTRCATDCPNYILTWSNVPPGAYDIRAKATDSGGAMAISAPVQIIVATTNIPPGTNLSTVTIVATDALAVEGPFCRSNWWWTTSWDGSNWMISPAAGNWTSPAWRSNNCSGINTATFSVRRSGPTNTPLTVYYAIGGTATNGIDYAALPGQVTLQTGQRSASIEVIPVEDSVKEQIETVVLNLLPSLAVSNATPGYLIGSARRAAAVIIDNDQPRPPCRKLPDGLFHLCGPATNGHHFTIRSSSDLKDWTVLCTNIVTDGAVHFIDPDALANDTRFYKVIPEPPSE